MLKTMFKKAKNIVIKLTTWILLIQMVNICTDPIDSLNIKYGKIVASEDLSINEIESVYELVAEKVFNKLVPESDERDEDTFNKVVSVYCLCNNFIELECIQTSIESQVFHNFYLDKCLFSILEINSPPPKFNC